MKTQMVIGAVATALIAGGCLVAFPGEPGHNLAGVTLILAGLHLVLYLMRPK